MKGETRPAPFSRSTSCWLQQRLHAADAGRVDHGAALRAHLGVAGVGPRELRARDRVLGERVGAAGFLGVEVVGDDEVGRVAGHRDGQVARVERVDRAHAVAPARQAGQNVVDAGADRA